MRNDKILLTKQQELIQMNAAFKLPSALSNHYDIPFVDQSNGNLSIYNRWGKIVLLKSNIKMIGLPATICHPEYIIFS